jgi:hypothetical protein
MADLHGIRITPAEVDAVKSLIQGPQPESFVGDVFDDIGKALRWLTGLAGEFCDAYNKGVDVDGRKVSLKEALQSAGAIATATGTPQGIAAAGAIALSIKILDAAC